MKKKLLALIIVIIAAIAAFFAIRHFSGNSSSEDDENTVYVQSVADFMGLGSGNGMINRFSGVVEAQDSWSVKQNSDSTVKEIYVSVDQEVTKGTPLFSYDTEQYQSDLAQAQIDLERLNNELTSLNNVLTDLQNQQSKASAADKESFNIQIEEQNLNIKQKNIDIQSKQIDIDKLQSNIDNAIVTSEIDGVVQKINTNTENSSDDSFITIMQKGDMRIKGRINEQNISDVYVGAEMIIYSRLDSTQTWKGTVTKIDTENKVDSSNSYYSDSAASSDSSTSYPFYVELESTDGLMLGQHIYMEIDNGQNEETEEEDGIWLDDYLIDLTDESNPFVWKDNNGTLIKQKITLGKHDDDLFKYLVTEGLSEDDLIAVPDESLSEGMKTTDMASMTDTTDTTDMTDTVDTAGMTNSVVTEGGAE